MTTYYVTNETSNTEILRDMFSQRKNGGKNLLGMTFYVKAKKEKRK